MAAATAVGDTGAVRRVGLLTLLVPSDGPDRSDTVGDAKDTAALRLRLSMTSEAMIECRGVGSRNPCTEMGWYASLTFKAKKPRSTSAGTPAANCGLGDLAGTGVGDSPTGAVVVVTSDVAGMTKGLAYGLKVKGRAGTGARSMGTSLDAQICEKIDRNTTGAGAARAASDSAATDVRCVALARGGDGVLTKHAVASTTAAGESLPVAAGGTMGQAKLVTAGDTGADATNVEAVGVGVRRLTRAAPRGGNGPTETAAAGRLVPEF